MDRESPQQNNDFLAIERCGERAGLEAKIKSKHMLSRTGGGTWGSEKRNKSFKGGNPLQSKAQCCKEERGGGKRSSVGLGKKEP